MKLGDKGSGDGKKKPAEVGGNFADFEIEISEPRGTFDNLCRDGDWGGEGD